MLAYIVSRGRPAHAPVPTLRFLPALLLLAPLFLPAISPAQSLKAGKTISGLEFHEFHGSSRKLASLPKKVVLVNFWASWCAPCLAELPSIVRLWQKYRDRGFEVVPVNIDDDPETAVPKVVGKLSLPFPIYVDTGAALQKKLGVSTVPTTLVMTPKGKVLFAIQKDFVWDSPEFESKLEGWLK